MSGTGTKAVPDPRSVFVVHGRNLLARDAVLQFLQSVGLHTIPWETALKMTGVPTPFVGQVLEAGLSQAQAVLVLLTGDDIARIGRHYGREALTPQPRANVIFEAGAALALFPKRTVFVQIGTLRGFSDLAGRHVFTPDGTAESMRALAGRLSLAGCTVDLDRIDTVKPLGQDLAVEDADPSLDLGRKRIFFLLSAIAVSCLLLGALGHFLWEHRRGDIEVAGVINATRPVTIYFVAGQETRSAPGQLKSSFTANRASYEILCIEDGRVRCDEDVPVIKNRISLPPYPRVEGYVASDSEVDKFRHGKQ